VPALSLPIGRTEGLPLGGQLIGPALGDDLMLEAAAVLEGALDPMAEVQ
jgi:Asp-tRNA(Asn)/Glu-tRNA(Gln) amidotransferase A subunit family amidase